MAGEAGASACNEADAEDQLAHRKADDLGGADIAAGDACRKAVHVMDDAEIDPCAARP